MHHHTNRLLQSWILSCALLLLAAAASSQTMIYDAEDLHNIRNDAGGDYMLANDLDLDHATLCALYGNVNGSQGNWYDEVAGWEPLGAIDEYGQTYQFWGTFDGDGHVIRNLYINRPGDYSTPGLGGNIGLFGWMCGDPASEPSPGWNNAPYGEVRNLGVESADVTGAYRVGILVGHGYGDITNCWATGTVRAEGANDWGYPPASTECGGLIGVVTKGTITDCYSTADVSGEGIYAGGFCGSTTGGSIDRSFATGTATALAFVGGFTGGVQDAFVNDCYALGDATATGTTDYYGSCVGGFSGVLSDWDGDGLINRCYAIGSVSGPGTGVEPFLSNLDEAWGPIATDCFYNLDINGVATNGAGTPLTTVQMTYPHDAAAYTNWDFLSIWAEDTAGANGGYPYLGWYTPPVPDAATITQAADVTLLGIGDTSRLTISANPAAGVAWLGINIVLQYDPAYLDLSNWAPLYDHATAGSYLDVVENVPGTLELSVAVLGGTEPASADLFELTFAAIAEPPTPHTTALQLISADVRDIENQSYSPIGLDEDEVLEIDGTPPPAVIDLDATPEPTSSENGVALSWTLADASDVDHYEIWRAVWHTGDNTTSA